MEEVQLRLLEHCMRESGHDVALLGTACTSKGKWLDAWMRWARAGGTSMLQVEVKSWSMHGYGGGTPLPADASGDQLGAYLVKEWARTWNFAQRRFIVDGLDKVRRRMRTSHEGEVIPLACLWGAMHPDGNADEPLFEVETQGDFGKVMVFSVSAYLRQHLRAGKGDWITLNLPKSAARLGLLGRMFGFSAPAPKANVVLASAA